MMDEQEQRYVEGGHLEPRRGKASEGAELGVPQSILADVALLSEARFTPNDVQVGLQEDDRARLQARAGGRLQRPTVVDGRDLST